MADGEDLKSKSEGLDSAKPLNGSPLIFISHDSRDAELAEAFSKLVKSVSAGMIKTFRSSDRKGNDGLDFGEEWYRRLMEKLQATSDVICLFTERSLDRPWILFEAGVAKGKLERPVIGIALGVPLSRVSTGPFYQFQNMEDSEDDLVKLVNQLARRVDGLDLDADVVLHAVRTFKDKAAATLKALAASAVKKPTTPPPAPDESAIAKLVEEMKSLPTRVAERVADEPIARRRRSRRISPRLLHQVMDFGGRGGPPANILLVASSLRDDMPWLYELGMEAYRAASSGDPERVQREMYRLREFTDAGLHRTPLGEEMFDSKEEIMLAHEFPRMLHHMLETCFDNEREFHRPLKRPATPEA